MGGGRPLPDDDGRPAPPVRAARLLPADDRLFRLAGDGRRLSTLLVAAVVSWVFLFVSRVPGLFVDDVSWWQQPPSGSTVDGALWLIAHLWLRFVPLALLTLAWVVWAEGRPIGSLPLPRNGMLRQVGVGAGFGLAMIAALVGIVALFGTVRAVPGGDMTGVDALPGVALVLAGWVVQAGSEELVSRGWLLASLGARYGPWIGVFASSLLFASFHALNPGFGWLPAVNLCLIGVVLALVAVWNGTLWGALALHTAWNWALANLLGLSVSGMPAPGGSLVDLELSGSVWITGGEFGIEGGLPATVVAGGAVLGMVVVLRRRRVRSSNRG